MWGKKNKRKGDRLQSGLAEANEAEGWSDTPIIHLFRLWADVEAEARASGRPRTDADLDRWLDKMNAFERLMMEMPVTCAADLAAKIACNTAWGDHLDPGVLDPAILRDVKGLLPARASAISGSSLGHLM